MAIIKQRGLQVTVQNIAERNAITKRPDHLVVHVIDAISDPLAGSGTAIYRWDTTSSEWILISAGAEKTVTFETFKGTIDNGQVILPNIPLNNNLWDMNVQINNVVYAFPQLEDLTVFNGTVSNLDEYNGYTFSCTYAYGSITTQLQSVFDTKSTLYEQNVDPLTETDNRVKAGDFWHDTGDTTRIAICLTINEILTWMEV